MRWLLSSFAALLPLTAFGAPPMGDRDLSPPKRGFTAAPNVLLVMTDDQGYGDLGAHGNPIIKTPNLDAFTKESVRLKNFYVSPVCSPTRSSLMTGQYNYRVGIVDTFLGRSMMRTDAKTIAHYLSAAGYRTGIFGKWHLGDNYPLRPEDRGFQETLWNQGGGLAQPSDNPAMDPNTAYFNPILKHNGKDLKTKGYCTDVFTDAALKFIKADSDKPFFAYVAYNCPHAPFQVPEELAKPYTKFDLTANGFPKIGQPWTTRKLNTDAIAHAYGMVDNIDTNFGRMLKALDDKRLAKNTIVIFLSDNGVGGVRWNAGLRNRKGSVYEGGIRSPCYVRWPGKTKPGRVIDTPLAHIDITPTLCDICGVKTDTAFDGKSFAKLLTGESNQWTDRTLFFQWHRGDEPEKFRAFCARGPKYKLVQFNGVAPNPKWKPKYELFDITADPYEQKDLAAEKPEQVARLKKQYELWFADVTKRGFAPPRIVIGSEKENPVRLSREDWRGPKAGWNADSIGHWEIEFAKAGRYKLTIRSREEFSGWEYKLSGESAGVSAGASVDKPTKVISTEQGIGAGKALIEGHITVNGKKRGPMWLELEYLGPAGKK